MYKYIQELYKLGIEQRTYDYYVQHNCRPMDNDDPSWVHISHTANNDGLMEVLSTYIFCNICIEQILSMKMIDFLQDLNLKNHILSKMQNLFWFFYQDMGLSFNLVVKFKYYSFQFDDNLRWLIYLVLALFLNSQSSFQSGYQLFQLSYISY